MGPARRPAVGSRKSQDATLGQISPPTFTQPIRVRMTLPHRPSRQASLIGPQRSSLAALSSPLDPAHQTRWRCATRSNVYMDFTRMDHGMGWDGGRRSAADGGKHAGRRMRCGRNERDIRSLFSGVAIMHAGCFLCPSLVAFLPRTVGRANDPDKA